MKKFIYLLFLLFALSPSVAMSSFLLGGGAAPCEDTDLIGGAGSTYTGLNFSTGLTMLEIANPFSAGECMEVRVNFNDTSGGTADIFVLRIVGLNYEIVGQEKGFTVAAAATEQTFTLASSIITQVGDLLAVYTSDATIHNAGFGVGSHKPRFIAGTLSGTTVITNWSEYITETYVSSGGYGCFD